jgi:pimeloyl-ACP methyl ester carboxylesterase
VGAGESPSAGRRLAGREVSLREEAVWIPAGGGLAGILTRASDLEPRPEPAVLLLNAGLVYRVGPNRLYVRLARRLAGEGFPALRLDLSGIGDSPPRSDRMQFDASAPLETSQVMDWMAERLGIRRFLLLGICSGGRAGFRTAMEDHRVAGVALLNPRSLGPEEHNDLREVADSYHALRVLGQRTRWRRALTGRVDYRTAARNLLAATVRLRRRRAAVGQVSEVVAAFRELVERGVHLGFFFSEGEPGRTYLRLALGSNYDSLLAHPRVQEHVIPLADHTFTWPSCQDALFEALDRWTSAWIGGEGPTHD